MGVSQRSLGWCLSFKYGFIYSMHYSGSFITDRSGRLFFRRIRSRSIFSLIAGKDFSHLSCFCHAISFSISPGITYNSLGLPACCSAWVIALLIMSIESTPAGRISCVASLIIFFIATSNGPSEVDRVRLLLCT